MNKDWERIVCSIARSLWRPGYQRWFDIEDLIQAGWVNVEKVSQKSVQESGQFDLPMVARAARFGMADYIRSVMNVKMGKGKTPAWMKHKKGDHRNAEFSRRDHLPSSLEKAVLPTEGFQHLREYTRFLLPEAAMVIRLIYEQDMTYQEVAAAIGKSDSWVHVVHRKSLLTLKQILERRESAAKRKSAT